jgi:hypothetical protein
LFWLDRWKDEYSLGHKFPLLFSISSNLNVTIFSSDQMQLSFNGQLVGLYHKEWSELHLKFRNFILNAYDADIFLWRWHSKRRFSVHSLYKWLEFGGFKNIKFFVL